MLFHMGQVIYTVGHSNRTIDEFVELLREHGIERLIDIRTMPRSRTNPQFNQDTLGPHLRNRKIGYRHMAGLGGLRHTTKNSVNVGWHNKSFRGYADYMQTDQFNEALETLIELAREKTTAIMCAESVPWRCHRSLVGDALLTRKFKVLDIMSKTSAKEHKLNPMAVVKAGKITYPSDLEDS
jgi:uncharacterized protein (DUF488 family)